MEAPSEISYVDDSVALKTTTELILNLKNKMSTLIFGQDDLVTEVLVSLLAGGHVIMTGVPGLAKTTLVRALSSHLSLKFRRVQFTPDLLPSDITGAEILNIDPASQRRVFEFMPGPVFTNLLLADEINRASPKTQSALLEAMQERSVTVGGETHTLPRPFMVLATQNPLESEGTFPLPEAQLDRFLIHSIVEYPEFNDEYKILATHAKSELFGEKQNITSTGFITQNDLEKMIEATKKVDISDELINAIAQVVRMTRPHDELCPDRMRELILYGAGPRAGIYLISAARALAVIEGSDFVKWKHIKRLAKPVLRHRIRLTIQGFHANTGIDELVQEILNQVETKAFLEVG